MAVITLFWAAFFLGKIASLFRVLRSIKKPTLRLSQRSFFGLAIWRYRPPNSLWVTVLFVGINMAVVKVSAAGISLPISGGPSSIYGFHLPLFLAPQLLSIFTGFHRRVAVLLLTLHPEARIEKLHGSALKSFVGRRL